MWPQAGSIGRSIGSTPQWYSTSCHPYISLEAGYFRRTFGNQTVTDNESVTPADFTPFCFNLPAAQQLGVTTPVGLASLGNLPGNQICGAYDIIPSLAGVASHQVIQFANKFPGTTSQTYNGFDVNVNAHPTGKFFVLAGVSVGKIVTKNCAQVDNPMTLLYCVNDQPFLASYRVSGGYTLPWKILVSGVYQSIPPTELAGADPWLDIFQRYVYVQFWGQLHDNEPQCHLAWRYHHAWPADCDSGRHHFSVAFADRSR